MATAMDATTELCVDYGYFEIHPNPETFIPFPKIPRLYRDIEITEKIDGTNVQIVVPDDDCAPLLFGSRNRWISPGKLTDHFDFARWGVENQAVLRRLGPGRHYGEWYGVSIGRRYNLAERRLALFDTRKWLARVEDDDREFAIAVAQLPRNVHVVPVLYRGPFLEGEIQRAMRELRAYGSKAAMGFMEPEGIVVHHLASGQRFKYTLDGDATKGLDHVTPADA